MSTSRPSAGHFSPVHFGPNHKNTSCATPVSCRRLFAIGALPADSGRMAVRLAALAAHVLHLLVSSSALVMMVQALRPLRLRCSPPPAMEGAACLGPSSAVGICNLHTWP